MPQAFASFDWILDDKELTAMVAAAPAKAQAALAQTATITVSYARMIVPVDTGYLRSTIGWSMEGTAVKIEATADYASYVEYGTSKMAPQPYLWPAVWQSRAALVRNLRAVLTPARVY